MSNIATIDLEKLEFYAYHGCYEQEQVVGNKFEVNISIKTDISTPMISDNIEDALNYVKVYELVREEIMINSHLLEHVTNRIMDRLMNEFESIIYLKAKVSKMNPPMGGEMRCVSMTLERNR